MNIFIYDKTFEGLLCAVFDAFTLKSFPSSLHGPDASWLCSAHRVETTPEKSRRVFAALRARLSEEALRGMLQAWLSELPGCEMPVFRYICKALRAKRSIEHDLADPDVWELTRLRRKVGKEAERFLGFVRFQKSGDGLYFSAIAPKYDVLPLISGKLAERFHDQRWIVYDLTRRYGVLFTPEAGPEGDSGSRPAACAGCGRGACSPACPKRRSSPVASGGSFEEIFIAEGRLEAGFLRQDDLAAGEALLEDMWRGYHAATAIKGRSNKRLQCAFMPKRFWGLLTEKRRP